MGKRVYSDEEMNELVSGAIGASFLYVESVDKTIVRMIDGPYYYMAAGRWVRWDYKFSTLMDYFKDLSGSISFDEADILGGVDDFLREKDALIRHYWNSIAGKTVAEYESLLSAAADPVHGRFPGRRLPAHSVLSFARKEIYGGVVAILGECLIKRKGGNWGVVVDRTGNQWVAISRPGFISCRPGFELTRFVNEVYANRGEDSMITLYWRFFQNLLLAYRAAA